MTAPRARSDHPILDLGGVRVRLGDRDVLGPLSWQVAPGEHWVVVGPNGCGKSTLLRVCGLRLHPTVGTVRVLGHELGRTDVRTVRQGIGLVGARVGDELRAALTAREVVVCGRTGVLEPWWQEPEPHDGDRARHLLDLVGAGGLADAAWGTLSSGERQRVQLARALMADPALLLLDEPAAGLDLPGREGLLAALDALVEVPGAPATVLVTHHVEEIPRRVGHALVLGAGGRPVAAGGIEQALTGEALTESLGMAVRLRRDDGRWWVSATGHTDGLRLSRSTPR